MSDDDEIPSNAALLQSPSKVVVDRIKYRNLLDELLGDFKKRHRRTNKQLEHTRIKVHEQRTSFDHETYKTILEKNIKKLLKGATEQEFAHLCAELCQGDKELHQRMFCDYVYTFLMNEHKSVKLLSELSSDAPPVTRNQQRIFTLISELDNRTQFAGVIERFLNLLYHGFFGLDRMFNMNMSSLLSLSRLMVLCARHIDDLDCMKRFVLDLCFFKSPRVHLIIGVIIDLWPELFEKTGPEFAPEEEALLWTVFHTNDLKHSPEMRVMETRIEIQKRYGYNPFEFEAKNLVIKYLNLAETCDDSETLESIKYSLFMLGRGNDYRWVNNNVVSRLLKLLEKVWSPDKDDQSKLRWVMECIGMVSRLYPVEGRQQLTDLFDSVKGLLAVENKLDPSTIESCVSALLHLGYHLQAQVSMFLVEWTPGVELSQETKEKLQDFLGTRGLKHAEITSNVARAKENKKLKNRWPVGGLGGRGGRGSHAPRAGRGGRRQRGGRGGHGG